MGGGGGGVCEICVAAQGQSFEEGLSLRVSSLTLDTLDTILVSPLSHLEMPEAVTREITIVAEAMIRAHFGEEPKARYFMDGLIKELPQMVRV